MTRPRCARCAKPTAVQATLAGQFCKRCAGRLPPHLRRDPIQPRPNADRSHRPTKRAGVGTTRPPQPSTPTPKQPHNRPCPCGSGHKVRHCHGRTPEQWQAFLAKRGPAPNDDGRTHPNAHPRSMEGVP